MSDSYKVVRETNLNLLESSVNSEIRGGLYPCGGVSLDNRKLTTTYLQAVSDTAGGGGGGGEVTSVNGKTGAVVLRASDVHALPDSTVVPTKTSQLTNDSQFISEGDLATVATTGKYSDLSGKPNLATVATTGSYSDLSGKPTIPSNVTDLSDASNYPTFTDLATVATTGAYNDLTGKPSLATVATTGAYSDLTGKPTIPASVTDLSDASNYPTFSDLATVATTGDYSDLANKPTVDTSYDSLSNNAIANSTVTASLDRNVVVDVAVDQNPSTSVVKLVGQKTNLKTHSSTVSTDIPLPVASATQAGVMNAATFQAVSDNANNINALLNGAVAITGLASAPLQSELTSAWQTATGLSTLINRAGIYDVTNEKIWTYYTNTSTWYSATNTSQVTVNQFTNSSLGTIMGSTSTGQIFAENDGTGSVNGWDALNTSVSNNTSKLDTIERGAEVNVQSDWNESDNTADGYIKNKPTLATVATTGDYSDLSGAPTLATVATTGDYTDLSNTPSLATVATSGSYNDLSNTPSLATVATSGSYNDLTNKPTIPTVNNATLTIQKNGTDVATFTANSSTATTANITVPTNTSDLTNNSGFITSSYVDGTTETYTIATSGWSALSSSTPYTYSATVTATYSITNNTIVHLLNDQAVAFATYGFAVGSVSGQAVTIYSVGQPDASVTLKINYKESS